MTPRPENGRNFFWWPIGVQNYQGTHRNWFWPFFGAPRGPFSKNPKIYVFQISNFPGQFSWLLLDLESWNFFWYALILCLADSSIPHCLVWFGLVWTGIWCHFWKSALLKKAIDKFLIFWLKRDYPTILHWCLKAFAVRSFLLGVMTNFLKNFVPPKITHNHAFSAKNHQTEDSFHHGGITLL